ncbi:hypothetical protein JYU34_022546 [Plutella xylostella]|uniref:MADF domain-containing protein n=1 Tax=Plutella xylostella TaxID=51655 RepID=A0ABQ7PQ24_PLUXY|nr:hypothetical protein JYU34_022546 [Plutella xylostella]
MIIQRWTHIRDNYNRSCKKIKDQKSSGSGAKTAKPYVYSKQLSFLQKVIQPKETINNVTTENNNMESNKNIESEIQNNNSEGGNETLETNSIETHGTTAAKSPIPNRVP